MSRLPVGSAFSGHWSEAIITKEVLLGLIMCAGMLSATLAGDASSALFSVERSLDIARVPAEFPVRFCLLTGGERQYVAYYDTERRMTVASRTLNASKWRYQVLPSQVGWDSHNYITMAIDKAGHLHVSGNMHGVPLIYFRTERPGNIATLKRLPMTGSQEKRATYPQFLTNHEGELIFNYRDGGSGNGKRIYNKYALQSRTWSRLLETPLLDGEGKRNAYPLGPIQGPQGWFHMVWVWRDTPDCATNHHLCYARSKDLVHWTSPFGQNIHLPITLNDKGSWIDPVPSRGGIINGCEKLFFDAKDRPIVSYHKADIHGNMQVYAARPENGQWRRHVLTDWKKPLPFSGRGSMGFIGIRLSGLTQVKPGILAMTYRHRDYGKGQLVIDEQTLSPLKKIEIVPEFPHELSQVQSDFAGMTLRRAHDLGDSGNEAVRYVLQWETLGSHHDRPPPAPWPQPSMLKLYKLKVNRILQLPARR